MTIEEQALAQVKAIVEGPGKPTMMRIGTLLCTYLTAVGTTHGRFDVDLHTNADWPKEKQFIVKTHWGDFILYGDPEGASDLWLPCILGKCESCDDTHELAAPTGEMPFDRAVWAGFMGVLTSAVRGAMQATQTGATMQ